MWRIFRKCAWRALRQLGVAGGNVTQNSSPLCVSAAPRVTATPHEKWEFERRWSGRSARVTIISDAAAFRLSGIPIPEIDAAGKNESEHEIDENLIATQLEMNEALCGLSCLTWDDLSQKFHKVAKIILKNKIMVKIRLYFYFYRIKSWNYLLQNY